MEQQRQVLRSPGTRAGLTLSAILDAAGELAPEDLDLQAVADRLGVDRTTVRHHVQSRERLLQMLALKAFAVSFSKVRIPRGRGWEAACRRFAYGFVNSLHATGVLVSYFGETDPAVTGVLKPAEALAKELLAAGCGDGDVVRMITMLSAICTNFARDATTSQRQNKPRAKLVRSALAADSTRYDTLRRLATLNTDTYDRKQLDLSIEVFLAGSREVFGLR